MHACTAELVCCRAYFKIAFVRYEDDKMLNKYKKVIHSIDKTELPCRIYSTSVVNKKK